MEGKRDREGKGRGRQGEGCRERGRCTIKLLSVIDCRSFRILCGSGELTSQ